MNFFAFWNKALTYLLSLYAQKRLDQRSFSSFFYYVSENKDRLLSPERQAYYDKLQERYQTYMNSRGNALDTIQKTGHYYHKTTSLSRENAVLVKEAVFDTVVFTNEMYVGICNLFEVNETAPQYVS